MTARLPYAIGQRMTSGGYDDGYRESACFWGGEPSSLVLRLSEILRTFEGLRVLDAGAGEGKNAVFVAARGAVVDALDISRQAISNGLALFGPHPRIKWRETDVRTAALERDVYDVVLAYGLYHCHADATEVAHVAMKLKQATKPGGWHAVCCFNNRDQDLSGHPGFQPCLLPHGAYAELYDDWIIDTLTDSDLYETHPHNGIPHRHSMTRLLAKRPENDANLPT